MHRKAFKLMYGDFVKYTCAEGYHAKMRNGEAKTDDPKSFQSVCKSSGDLKNLDDLIGHECVPVTCHVPVVGPEAKLIYKTASGGDWSQLKCDAGSKLIAGGCQAAGHPHTFAYGAPTSPDEFQCGGNGGPKNLWAICSSAINPVTVKVSGGDWTTATCPTGTKILSGGCWAKSHPHVMSWNGPKGDDAWQCGGHGGAKDAWAICSAQLKPTIIESDGGDWHTVKCPVGMSIIGGGCDGRQHPHKFEKSSPVGDNQWMCGGQGGSKKVWAICAPINEAAEQFPAVTVHDSMKRTFGQTIPMLCGEGYSLDGKPTGQVDFTEHCTADAVFSQDHKCTDIDWCLKSKCGDHGTCMDGTSGYLCDCDEGF
jgi:hypothetical protein